MRHSGWYPDYVLRLFRRGRGHFSDHLVHTRVICDGRVKRLATPLTHFAIRRIHDSIAKMDSYSTAGAAEIVAARRTVKFSSGITPRLGVHPLHFLRLGFTGEGFCWRCSTQKALTTGYEGLAYRAQPW
jgi:hypothetical protein